MLDEFENSLKNENDMRRFITHLLEVPIRELNMLLTQFLNSNESILRALLIF